MPITNPAMFIGESVVSGTSGSILYVDSGLLLAQDNANLFWDATNHRLGIGATTVSAKAHVVATTEQLRLGYDASNYLSVTVSSAGALTFSATGASAGFTVSQNTSILNVLGVGIAVNTTASIAVGGNQLTGTTQRSFLTQTTANESCTVEYQGLALQVRTKATSFTCALGNGIKILDASIGAGSTVTTLVGLDIAAQTGGGTNNYAIRSIVATGGNNPWNLFITGTAPNHLNGNVAIGTQTIASGATFNIELGGGSTSPVLGGVTADIVSFAAVDKAAGDRRLYIQSEAGGVISLGNDRLNFAAATGNIAIGDTDVANIISTQFDSLVNMKVPHLIGRSTAPTIAAGTGAGTAPTVSVSNATDLSGIVNVTTGTLPVAASTIVTITFNVAYGQAPNVVITAANAATAVLGTGSAIFVTSTTTTFVFTSGSVGALAAATTYKWFYVVVQ